MTKYTDVKKMSSKSEQWRALHADFVKRVNTLKENHPSLVSEIEDYNCYMVNADDARDIFVVVALPEIKKHGVVAAVAMLIDDSNVSESHEKLFVKYKEELYTFITKAYSLFQ